MLHDKITSITNTKANDSNTVHKFGNETIAGVKTFSNQIIANSGIKGSITGNAATASRSYNNGVFYISGCVVSIE